MRPFDPPPLDSLSQKWFDRAGRLAAVMETINSPDVRLAVLKKLCDRVEEPGFPGIIKIMMTIAESNNAMAKRNLAQVIGLALQRFDMPSGELTAWGAGWDQSDQWVQMQRQSSTPIRRFGPIEYLTVWYCQKTQRPYLSDDAYQMAIARLIELINLDDQARVLYPQKILSDLAHQQEGNFSKRSRQNLRRLAEAWQGNLTPDQIATVIS